MEYQCLTIKPSQIVDLMYNSGILPTIYACRFDKEILTNFYIKYYMAYVM